MKNFKKIVIIYIYAGLIIARALTMHDIFSSAQSKVRSSHINIIVVEEVTRKVKN
jgi:hypothetical protein